jgi:hypothetical protein
VYNARLSHRAAIKAIITTVIIKYLDIPSIGLLQSIYNLYHQLSIKDILFTLVISEDSDIIGVDIIHGLIFNIIRRVHTKGINLIYPNTNYLIIPTIKRLSTRKTEFW